MTFSDFLDAMDKKPFFQKAGGIVDWLPPILAWVLFTVTIAVLWIVWVVTPPRFLK